MLRDIIVSLVLIGLMPISFRKPFVGLLVFSLLAYMRIQDLTWDFARTIRWSFYFAIIMFAGFFVSNKERRFSVYELRISLMLLLVVLVGLSIVTNRGIDPKDLGSFLEYAKIIVIAMFTTGLVNTRARLRMLLWVITLSFAFFGFKSGIAGILTLGRIEIIRGPGGMMLDNNDFALALAMSVPMLVMVGLSERRQILRRALLACVPLTMITIGLTHSRGGFLALSLAILVMVFRSRQRLMGFALVGLMVVAGALLAPHGIVDRIKSIGDYQQDPSAQARFSAWRVAGSMIQSKPLLGVGFGHFQDNYKRYDPAAQDPNQYPSGGHVAHNSYLQIWAECGTPTFLLYLLMIGLCFVDLWDVRRKASRLYHSSWILNYATMFEASLATFVLGSMFLNRAHFDLLYHLVSIIVAFGIIAREHMTDPDLAPNAGSGRGVLRQVSNSSFEHPAEPRGFDRRPSPEGGF